MKNIVSLGAKKIAVGLSPILRRPLASKIAAAISTYIEFLGGKGAGSGWDHINEISTVASFISASSPVILDIGANNGAWSESLSRYLPAEASFHLFECAPYCFHEIERRLPSISNSIFIRKAVSETTGKVILHLPTLGSGLASLHERKDVGVEHHDYEEIQVDAISLDDYAELSGLGRIDLLKMDIEGHELFALKGANKLLERVQTIFFEFGSANVNSRTFFRDFWGLLSAQGYNIFRILPGGGTIAIPYYSETLEYFRGATNYIATRE